MKALEFFDSQKRENAKKVQLHREHRAGKGAMLAETNKIDVGKCIPLAHALAAQNLAGSPLRFETEALLIKARGERDAIPYAWRRTLEDMEKEILLDTNPIINDKAEAWLELAKRLPEKYAYSRQGEIDFRGNIKTMVSITTNSDALDAARDMILESRKKLMEMRLCGLTEIEEFIRAFDRKYELLDLSVLQVEEVTADQARERQPQANAAVNIAKGMLMPDHSIHIHPGSDDPKIKALGARLSKLEQGA